MVSISLLARRVGRRSDQIAAVAWGGHEVLGVGTARNPPGVRAAGIVCQVEPDQETLTAAELDAMTPDERRGEFERRVVRDAAELSDDLRERIRSTAEGLARARAGRRPTRSSRL